MRDADELDPKAFEPDAAPPVQARPQATEVCCRRYVQPGFVPARGGRAHEPWSGPRDGRDRRGEIVLDLEDEVQAVQPGVACLDILDRGSRPDPYPSSLPVARIELLDERRAG